MKIDGPMAFDIPFKGKMRKLSDKFCIKLVHGGETKFLQRGRIFICPSLANLTLRPCRGGGGINRGDKYVIKEV